MHTWPATARVPTPLPQLEPQAELPINSENRYVAITAQTPVDPIHGSG